MEDEYASFGWSLMGRNRDDIVDIVELGCLQRSHSSVERERLGV